MPIRQASSAINAAGISLGATEGVRRHTSTEGQANRAELRTLKAQREAELKQIQAKTDEDYELQADVERNQLQALNLQLQQAQSDSIKTRVYGAFDKYTSDFNPRHFNTMLKDVTRYDAGQRLFGEAVRFDRITAEDKPMLDSLGIDPDLIMEHPELTNSILKVTKNNGEQELIDVNTLMQMSGYDRYAEDRELERQAKVLQLAQAGRSGSNTELERQAERLARTQGLSPDTPEFEEFVANYIEEQRQAPRHNSAAEREADRYARQFGQPNSPEYQQAFGEKHEEIVARDRQTSRSRELDEVETAKSSIDTTAQEQYNRSFFDIDLTKRENRLKFENDIRRIARLSGAELSASELSELSQVRQLVALGEPAAELTEAETGLIDNILVGFRRYISDNVTGLDSTAAYHTFRNTMRHAIYGSQLTQHEIQSMNRQFGTMGQQLGPVLQQFQTSLVQLRSRLDTLFNTNDSYVMQFYAGADQEQLANIMSALDDRIAFIQQRSTGGTIRLPQEDGERRPGEPGALQSLEPERREELIRILSGGNE